MNHSSMPPRRPSPRTTRPSGGQARPNGARPTASPRPQQPSSSVHRPVHPQQPTLRQQDPRGYAARPQQPRQPQSPQSRPAASVPQGQRPTREEIIRRKRYLERKRAEERRRKQMRTTIAALLGLLILAVLLAIIRSCGDSTDAPVSADAVIEANTSDTTERIAETTASVTPSTTAAATAPAVTTAPPAPVVVTPASASRPRADASTVTLTDEIDSGYAALIAPASGRILASKNAEARMYPASMTKVMTLLVAYENITDVNETFTVTSTIIDPLYRANASLAGFSPGETVTVLDLMYGTILPSGAEAAVSLAIHVAGSEEAFVRLMNEKAKELGLKDTHFTNCSGLHNADHYSTAVEIAMIMDCAMQHELCREILSTYQYTTPFTNKHTEGVAMTSTMFSRMYGDEPDGVTIRAGKTGYTTEGGQCLVSYGTDDVTGEAFILVTAKADGKFEPVFDAIEVYSDYTKKKNS